MHSGMTKTRTRTRTRTRPHSARSRMLQKVVDHVYIACILTGKYSSVVQTIEAVTGIIYYRYPIYSNKGTIKFSLAQVLLLSRQENVLGIP